MWEFRVPLFERNHRRVRAWAVVDEADLYGLLKFRWTFSGGYAARTQWRKVGPNLVIPMHRHLLGLKTGDGLQVDHINRDRLDNRRSNLRLVSRFENAQNVPGLVSASSKYRGVSWQKQIKRWRADVRVDGRTVYLGTFLDEEEAARVAREYRLAHMAGAVD